MAERMVRMYIPESWQVDLKVGKHQIRRLLRNAATYEGPADTLQVGRSFDMYVLPDGTSVVHRRNHAPDGDAPYLIVREETAQVDQHVLEFRDLAWRRAGTGNSAASLEGLVRQARRSWQGEFKYIEELDGRPGFRVAQLGAIHALLAHWSVGQTAATVVLPTGTGKTDTMIAALVAGCCSPLLVIVPSIALRDQISEKFQQLGKLHHIGAVSHKVEFPVVGTLMGVVSDEQQALEIFASCNVVVSTMDSLSHSPGRVREVIASIADRVFVDEAHHIPARTWSEFKDLVSPSKVAQFTATPFRGDSKVLPGRVIYQYPLRKAQEDGYFQTIRLRPVFEYDPTTADRAIATTALEQLELDLADNLNHIVMARVSTIDRAEEIAELYRSMTDQRVEVVYTGLSTRVKRSARAALESSEARVVVCVDMLGEGYDLPTLKIAALHDAHRSVGVTLQFIGRFTRTASGIGAATAIANIADIKMAEKLEQLYSQDADWNVVLSRLAEGAISDHQRRLEFLDGFDTLEHDISIQNIKPKKSAEVYRLTRSTWFPERMLDVLDPERTVFTSINSSQHVAVAVMRRADRVSWGDISNVRDITHDLLVLFLDTEHRLLYIHSSDTGNYHQKLANEVTNGDAVQIKDMDVFRCLHGINRLLVANLGLKHAIGKSIYFTMYAGINVHEGLTEQNLANKLTSNLFGFGFEDGDRASAGCSLKGRVWSYRISEDISDWVRWCKQVGGKLSDISIDPAEFLRTRMRATRVSMRPPGLVPIAIEWNESVWQKAEDAIYFSFGNSHRTTLVDVGIRIPTFSEEDPIQFEVYSGDGAKAVYELAFDASGAKYRHLSGASVSVKLGRVEAKLHDWLADEPPTIRFSNGQQLVGDLLISAPDTSPPFDENSVGVWDWTEVDIQQESQRAERRPMSIQRSVIQRLVSSGEFDVIFDDDGSNEVADVVALRVSQDKLDIRLYHLKFASKGMIRNRVEDLYELCGQAQRSVHWKGDRLKLIEHLIRRESLRNAREGGGTRFEQGDLRDLHSIARRMRYLDTDMEIVLVHPGISKDGLTPGQLELLATTQLYLSETYSVPLTVVVNE